jgi:septal ring factor EnvC (AmiA/AmiB activator)
LTTDPPRAGDVAPYVEDDRPATLGDLRSLRRWLLVTAVWAVAATALGVFALIQANKEDDSGRTQTAADLARVQKDLNSRLDDLESRIGDLPTSDDLTKLDGRIQDVEKKVDGTGSDIDKLNGRVDDLEQRMDELESANESQTNTTTTP